MSHSRGNHQFKFRVHFLHARPSVQQSANANARGNLNFQSVFTAQLEQDENGRFFPISGTGSGSADFLLGIPTIGQVVSMPRMHYRRLEIEPFFADTWRIRPNFTLNWSLSWYLSTPPDPEYLPTDRDRPHAFDFRTGRVLFAALGEIEPQIWETDWNNFAPRLGLAWHATPKNVIRAGFALFFIRQRLLDQQFAIVAPGVIISQSISNPESQPIPEFLLGRNTFPPISLQPITREFADNISGTFALEQEVRTGYVQQWNLSLQHQFSREDALELAYLGNHAVKLNNRWNANSCSLPDSLGCDRSVIPFPPVSCDSFCRF